MNTVKQLFVSMSALLLALTGVAQGSDTGFVARSIRNHIISIKLAQMAQERSDAPRIKTAAREIVSTDRETLRKLLISAEGKDVQGPTDRQLDSIIENFRTDSVLTPLDSEGAAMTGNTATDSLGSGKTGSGNSNGRDTGTMVRSHSKKRNASYASEGDYLYRNQPAIEALKGIDKKQGRQFNQSWLRYMLASSDARLRDFEHESGVTKDEQLKMTIIQAIPYMRSQKEQLSKLAKRDVAPAQRETPGTVGPSNRNTPRENQ